MSNDPDERPTQEFQGKVNTRPGPTEQGGKGGMATREQLQRLADEKPATDAR
jgi:hypothetical protein